MLLALISCSNPPGNPRTEEPNDYPPNVTLEASHLTGEAEFDVIFQANASDPDGNRLTYTWRVNGEQVGKGSSPTLTITFFEAG